MLKENLKQVVNLQVTDGLTVAVIQNQTYEFLMLSKDVALGYGVSAGTFAVSDGQRAEPQRNAGENTDASRYELCPGFLPYGTAGVCQQLF